MWSPCQNSQKECEMWENFFFNVQNTWKAAIQPLEYLWRKAVKEVRLLHDNIVTPRTNTYPGVYLPTRLFIHIKHFTYITETCSTDSVRPVSRCMWHVLNSFHQYFCFWYNICAHSSLCNRTCMDWQIKSFFSFLDNYLVIYKASITRGLAVYAVKLFCEGSTYLSWTKVLNYQSNWKIIKNKNCLFILLFLLQWLQDWII